MVLSGSKIYPNRIKSSWKTTMKIVLKDIFLKFKSSHPEVFLVKGGLKICSKFTGEYPFQSVISIKLHGNFIEITLRQRCSLVNLLHTCAYLWAAPFGSLCYVFNSYLNFLPMIYHFHTQQRKFKKLNNLQPTCMTKKNMLHS